MQLLQIDTGDRARIDQFRGFPFSLYRTIPQWVPPLAHDAANMLNRRRHPFYVHSDAAFFLAFGNDSKPSGRIAVLDNSRYNDFNHERTAFFYLFECVDDADTACALFEAATAWARARGLTRILGPKGFSALDGQGLLVRGFEHRPALGIPYNPAYYPALLEAAGFAGQEDVVSGYLSREMRFPPKIHKASEAIQRRRGLRVVRFRSRRELEGLLPALQAMYNGTIEGTPGNVPLTDAEMRTLANQLLWFADPKLIKVVMKDEEPVGFLLAYPDISAALQRTGGRLFPLGWIFILRELRTTKWLNINGAGIVAKYRGLGGTALLFSEMQKSVVESRFRHAEVVQVGVSNEPMQRELADLGIDFYKTHRMYARDL